MTRAIPNCRNTRSKHSNPYGDKYHGYCLDCWNAGVVELEEEAATLRANQETWYKTAIEHAKTIDELLKEVAALRERCEAAEKALVDERAKWTADILKLGNEKFVMEKERDAARMEVAAIIVQGDRMHQQCEKAIEERDAAQAAVAAMRQVLEDIRDQADCDCDGGVCQNCLASFALATDAGKALLNSAATHQKPSAADTPPA